MDKDTVKNAFKSRIILGKPRTPQTVKWFVKTGFTKTERNAGAILMALTVFNFFTSIVLVFLTLQR